MPGKVPVVLASVCLELLVHRGGREAAHIYSRTVIFLQAAAIAGKADALRYRLEN